MEAARFGHQRRLMIMNKKRMAKMYSTNIESSKKFGGGSHRNKKLDDISNAQCLRQSTPSLTFFLTRLLGLMVMLLL